ncbi:hypothetical protein [Streptomyces coerulescens]|uniref:Uncharacterized protein n=1 Tax=Streptomyces coerulescens TaxID=29304 RepID=A0ABW0CXV1_STRCD
MSQEQRAVILGDLIRGMAAPDAQLSQVAQESLDGRGPSQQ